MDPTYIALIGTLFGGAGLKIAEHYLGRSKAKQDEGTRIRDELRLEITRQAQEIKDLEVERDKYRNDWLDLRDEHNRVKTELTLALAKIKDEAKRAEQRARNVSNTE